MKHTWRKYVLGDIKSSLSKPVMYGEMSIYQYQLNRIRYAVDILWYHSTGLYLIFC